jgi:hypothetical protein
LSHLPQISKQKTALSTHIVISFHSRNSTCNEENMVLGHKSARDCYHVVHDSIYESQESFEVIASSLDDATNNKLTQQERRDDSQQQIEDWWSDKTSDVEISFGSASVTSTLNDGSLCKTNGLETGVGKQMNQHQELQSGDSSEVRSCLPNPPESNEFSTTAVQKCFGHCAIRIDSKEINPETEEKIKKIALMNEYEDYVKVF